nr:MAG TPA: hypothetical protein [Caudoviricetes sp.]
MTIKPFRNSPSLLQSHLCAIPVPAIRDALNLDDSGVSRIKTGERKLTFDEFCAIIALPSTAHPQGLALAPAKAIIIGPELFRALVNLAGDSINMMRREEGGL